MRRTQTTNGKKIMVITMRKTVPATKLKSQRPIVCNLNRNLGQSDPKCQNAF